MSGFEQLCADSPVLLDGATGTNLLAAGMPQGCCQEAWMLAHEDALMRLQRRYMEAGSRIVYAPTFSAQPCRLSRFSLHAQTERINERLALLSRKAAPGCLIAGSMTTLTGWISAQGEAGFCEMIGQYRRQIRGLAVGGADLIIGETLMSSHEALAILRAAQQERAGNVMLSFALLPDGRLRSGEDGRKVLTMLEQEGAAALGMNCVPADDGLPALAKALGGCISVPLIVKPNAGKPVHDRRGLCAYPVDAARFSGVLAQCADGGAALLGGCCGTTPEYIAALARRIYNAEKG